MGPRTIERWSPQFIINGGNRVLELYTLRVVALLERSPAYQRLARVGLVLLGLLIIGVNTHATAAQVLIGPFAWSPTLAATVAIAAGIFGPTAASRFSPSFPALLLLILLVALLHHTANEGPIIVATVGCRLAVLLIPMLLLRLTVRCCPAWSMAILATVMMGVLPATLLAVDFGDFAPTLTLALYLLPSPLGFLAVAMVLVGYAGVSRDRYDAMRSHWWEPAFLHYVVPLFDVRPSTRIWQELVLGARNLLLGVASIDAAFAGRHILLQHGFDVLRLDNFWYRGPFSYLFFFLMSWGIAQVFASFFQLTGRQLDDLFDWPLLAASPAIKWRTWNIPYYEWTRVLVFNPLMRKTGLLGFSIIVAFLANFVLHADRSIFSALPSHGPPSAEVVVFVLGTFVFFVLQGVAVWGAIRTRRYWPAPGSRRGWLGVGLTWLMMSAIHTLRIF